MYSEGTAVLLRLCIPFVNARRIVVADFYFSLVKTAIALHHHLNLRFMGIVKTATKKISNDFFKDWYSKGSALVNNQMVRERGSHCVLKVYYYYYY